MGCEVTYQLNEALSQADIVYLLRLQKERQRENFLPSLQEYSRLFGLDDSRYEGIRKPFFLMHPGPMNRGVEIKSALAEQSNSLILEQVTNGIAVRMAVLYLTMSGRR